MRAYFLYLQHDLIAPFVHIVGYERTSESYVALFGPAFTKSLYLPYAFLMPTDLSS
jgi:hypothetical protein